MWVHMWEKKEQGVNRGIILFSGPKDFPQRAPPGLQVVEKPLARK